MISEPLEPGIAEEIENMKIDIKKWGKKQLGDHFVKNYDWYHYVLLISNLNSI